MYLYKFSPWNDRLLESLIRKEVWFSHPSIFNDPFDSLILTSSQSYADIAAMHHRLIQTFSKGIPSFSDLPVPVNPRSPNQEKSFDILSYLYSLLISNRPSGYTMRGVYEKLVEMYSAKEISENVFMFIETVAKTKIFSASKTFNLPLLWQYYADNYRGVCLKFRYSESMENALPGMIECQEVEYGDLIKPLDTLKADDRFQIERQFFRKAEIHSHEQEIRIIHRAAQASDGETVAYDKIRLELEEVILGHRADTWKRVEILQKIGVEDTNLKELSVSSLHVESLDDVYHSRRPRLSVNQPLILGL